ncbi:STAS domain-containing protein [[Mycobacterium] wendilense]|uniref:STAS domain-containing protein n=1 Tax=[Mycobacterium] wendilense TaxID=3064284 RepID=A0ABM9MK84_9MYCO|nr:STAS domain-containing protein [Mycolicibacterium sp. MU0050]CAJ1587240.1 hypothetical protein MU0050_004692 [Mycolicibacterium sp. MU0050]
MATDWPEFDVARVLVSGDIDAAGTCDVRDYVLNKVLVCHRLVLDLTRVRFFSCDGYWMLKTLEHRCALAGIELKVLPGPYVTPVMAMCENAVKDASALAN